MTSPNNLTDPKQSMPDIVASVVVASTVDVEPSTVPYDDMAATVTQGEEMPSDSKEADRQGLVVKTYGRITYGEGAIDGAECSEPSFRSGLDYIKNNGLTTIDMINRSRHEKNLPSVASILDIYGNCMDGRRNKETLAGNTVELARPKVMGGPVLFLTYLQACTGTLQGNTLLDSFRQNTENNKFGASLHEGCGAARGFVPVLRKLAGSFDDINRLVGELTDGKMTFTDEEKAEVLSHVSSALTQAKIEEEEFTEANMIGVVRETSSDDAVLKFEVDEEHETHSHSERGLVYLWGAEGHDYIMVKDSIYDNDEIPNVFYQNAAYAKRLVKENFGRMHPQLLLAQKLAIALPLAAVGVLGKKQHVGSIGEYADIHERMVA